jgi:hypothetical protein
MEDRDRLHQLKLPATDSLGHVTDRPLAPPPPGD